MSFPEAFNSLANAAIAKVCDVDKLFILSDNGFIIVLLLVIILKKVNLKKISQFVVGIFIIIYATCGS